MDPYRTPAQAAAKLLVVPQAGGGLDMVLAFGTSIDAGADRTRVPADVVARYCAAVAPLPPPLPSYKWAEHQVTDDPWLPRRRLGSKPPTFLIGAAHVVGDRQDAACV